MKIKPLTHLVNFYSFGIEVFPEIKEVNISLIWFTFTIQYGEVTLNEGHDDDYYGAF